MPRPNIAARTPSQRARLKHEHPGTARQHGQSGPISRGVQQELGERRRVKLQEAGELLRDGKRASNAARGGTRLGRAVRVRTARALRVGVVERSARQRVLRVGARRTRGVDVNPKTRFGSAVVSAGQTGYAPGPGSWPRARRRRTRHRLLARRCCRTVHRTWARRVPPHARACRGFERANAW